MRRLPRPGAISTFPRLLRPSLAFSDLPSPSPACARPLRPSLAFSRLPSPRLPPSLACSRRPSPWPWLEQALTECIEAKAELDDELEAHLAHLERARDLRFVARTQALAALDPLSTVCRPSSVRQGADTIIRSYHSAHRAEAGDAPAAAPTAARVHPPPRRDLRGSSRANLEAKLQSFDAKLASEWHTHGRGRRP